MKFAKELDQEAVPEWRAKYLNYKAGKKHVKAVGRAIHRATATPTLTKRSDGPQGTTPAAFFGITHTFTPPRRTNARSPTAGPGPNHEHTGQPRSGSVFTKPGRPQDAGTEVSGLARSPGSAAQYGSIGPAPSRASDRHEFELPAPAIRVPSAAGEHATGPSPSLNRLTIPRSSSMRAAPGKPDHQSPSLLTLRSRGMSTTPRLRVPRLFPATGTTSTRQASKHDMGMQNLDYVRAAERDFVAFLDRELEKIESFYKEKENQATERLAELRAQLHEMRNRRISEIAEAKERRRAGRNRSRSADPAGRQAKDGVNRDWINPIKDRFLKPGPNSKALQRMARTPLMTGRTTDEGRDYVRRPHVDDVPYRTAKRKLKVALQEFYRGLELLKSYALLNRTAFRKLNKKYDKTVNARPPYRYMNEKVNKSWFVNSDILDGHIRTVEDLYARYFERGNRKIAAGKLRNLHKRTGDASGSAFRSGLLIGGGAVFAVQGLVYGVELLLGDHDTDPDLAERTGYLLQLYGGYFLALLLFALFTLDCRMWTKNRVNYPFIFEFDARNALDWKQLAEFPSFFFALFGVFLWLNFSRLGDWEETYLYYPVILICVTLVILFLPAPVLHHKARRWFLYSHYRLLLSGLYPVEFRDFFLGDIWCSLTYVTCNVELFFCLYANSWDNPVRCNSSHSRLLGFFYALPPIWRALQCVRRYRDTQNVFPHLVNCGKYAMTILAAVCLSLYRIGDSQTNLSLFIAFATVNAIYCSIWDLFMDFSLLQANAPRKLLREITAIRPAWIYYVIMVVDPLLRFSWIFYAIFTHDTQHSTIVSFMVALAEVLRRGMWTLLRVENEHCANVAQYKASRDTPLPYHLELFVQRPSLEAAATTAAAGSSAPHLAAQVGNTSPARARAGAPTPRTTTTTATAQVPSGSAQQPPELGSQNFAMMPTPDGGEHGALPPPPAAAAAAASAQISSSTPVDSAAAEAGSGRVAGARDTTNNYDNNINNSSNTTAPTFRLRRSDTLGRRSIRQAMAEAHKQDFEKRRVPPGEVGLDGAGVDEEVVGDEEEEEDEEEEDEEEVEAMIEKESEVPLAGEEGGGNGEGRWGGAGRGGA